VARHLRANVVEFGASTQVFGPAVARFFRESGAPIADSIGLSVHDGEGFALQFSAPARAPVRVHGHSRAAWRKLGLHLGIAWRLRRRLEAGSEPVALVAGGKIVDARGAAKARTARDALVEATRRLERARGKTERDDPERVLELWTGLVSGRWSLVDRWESDGRRYVAAYENRATPSARAPGLVPWDVEVLRTYLLRASLEETAFALGIEGATVERVLSNAARKLGLRGRAELARLSEPRLMTRLALEVGPDRVDILRFDDPRLPAAWAARLTAAQREVAQAAARGLTDAEIARERGTSVRTVSNLLAAAYRSLAVGGRKELIRGVLRHGR
jgi:DNA-binding CsgD family transcriptional regulator